MSANPSREQLAAASAASSHPVDPVSLANSAGRHLRGGPIESVSRSYATQQYAFVWGGRRVLLRPSEERQHPVRGPRLPSYFLSGWHPLGTWSRYDECEAAHERLRRALRGVSRVPSVAIGRERPWFEQGFLVRGIDSQRAVEIGHAAGQGAVVAWTAGRLVVLPTGLFDDVEAVTLGAALLPAPAGCPVRTDEVPVGRCVRRGGPFGSAAIHAGALSQTHRELAIRLLGCAPCRDGWLPTWGTWGGTAGPILLSPVALGSRHGGAGWT